MAAKNYLSFEELDRDIEILRLEREIHYRKLVKQFGPKSDENPEKPTAKLPRLAIDLVSGFAGPVKGALISYVLKRMFK